MTTLKLLETQLIAPVLGNACTLAFHPRENLLAVANDPRGAMFGIDGSVLLYPVHRPPAPAAPSLGTPVVLSEGADGPGFPGGLAFSAEGGLLAVANVDAGTVSLFTPLGTPGGWAPVPNSPFSIQPTGPRTGGVWYDANAVAFGQTETRTGTVATAQLATANDTNTVSLFEASSATGLTPHGVPHSTNAAQPNSVSTYPGATGVAFSHLRPNADRALLLATSNSVNNVGSASLFRDKAGLVRVTGSPFAVGGPPQNNSGAYSLAFHPKADLLAVAVNVSGVSLFLATQAGTDLTLTRTPYLTGTSGDSRATAVAFSPDGALLAVANTTLVSQAHATFAGSVTLFSVHPNPPRLTLLQGSPFAVSATPANALAFSADGKILAVANGNIDDGSVSLFAVM